MTTKPCVATMVDSIVNSVESALLTESQQHALDALCTEVRELFALGLEDDAKRTMKVALSLVACGPPVRD